VHVPRLRRIELIGKKTMETPIRISVDELKHELELGTPVFLIDARKEEEWRAAPDTAAGAVRMSAERAPERVFEVPPDKLVVVFCTCPAEKSSLEVVEAIRMGGRDARALEGGYAAYLAAGLPTVSKRILYAA